MKKRINAQFGKGEKIIEEKKEIEVKLDPGVPDNHVYTFPGEE